MKKRLNVDLIQNELRGGSAFFPGYKGSASPTPSADGPEKAAEGDGTRIPVPRPVRGTVPPPVPLAPKVKRLIRQRQPFDIYEDQYEQLKKIAESEREFINGRSMSRMVRDAIDNYLRDHCASKE